MLRIEIGKLATLTIKFKTKHQKTSNSLVLIFQCIVSRGLELAIVNYISGVQKYMFNPSVLLFTILRKN